MKDRQPVQNVVALRLARVDIIVGGFANLVFHSIDDVAIEPTIVMPLETIADTILQLTKATAIAALGTTAPAYN